MDSLLMDGNILALFSPQRVGEPAIFVYLSARVSIYKEVCVYYYSSFYQDSLPPSPVAGSHTNTQGLSQQTSSDSHPMPRRRTTVEGRQFSPTSRPSTSTEPTMPWTEVPTWWCLRQVHFWSAHGILPRGTSSARETGSAKMTYLGTRR